METALNYLGRQVAALGGKASASAPEVEALVCDWGSPEVPLASALDLSPEAAAITRVVEVPPELALARQRDSRFAEVVANNTAIRRARGRYVGRIDQDTLVGGEFLRRFLDRADATDDSATPRIELFFVGRREVPFAFAKRSVGFGEVCRFIDAYGPRLPREGVHQRPWFDAPVGIVILHRDHWLACRGYDERLLYWGFMETDLALRAELRGQVVDLERQWGCDFYHLGHNPSWFKGSPRNKNPRIRPTAFAPNGPAWGLANHSLPIRHLPPRSSREPGGPVARHDALRYLPSVAMEAMWQQVLAASRLSRGWWVGDRIDLGQSPSSASSAQCPAPRGLASRLDA